MIIESFIIEYPIPGVCIFTLEDESTRRTTNNWSFCVNRNF